MTTGTMTLVFGIWYARIHVFGIWYARIGVFGIWHARLYVFGIWHNTSCCMQGIARCSGPPGGGISSRRQALRGITLQGGPPMDGIRCNEAVVQSLMGRIAVEQSLMRRILCVIDGPHNLIMKILITFVGFMINITCLAVMKDRI